MNRDSGPKNGMHYGSDRRTPSVDVGKDRVGAVSRSAGLETSENSTPTVNISFLAGLGPLDSLFHRGLHFLFFDKFHDLHMIFGLQIDEAQTDSDPIMDIKYAGMDPDGLRIGVMKFELKFEMGALWKMFMRVQIHPADTEVRGPANPYPHYLYFFYEIDPLVPAALIRPWIIHRGSPGMVPMSKAHPSDEILSPLQSLVKIFHDRPITPR
jgi:hypothetical protein